MDEKEARAHMKRSGLPYTTLPEENEFLDYLSAMDKEYTAWQDVVKECQRLGIDMNLPLYDRLIKAICVWGERLHGLRAGQTPEQVEKALISNLDAYELAKQKSVKDKQ